MSRRCTAMTKAGKPCRAWAVRPAEHSEDGAVAGSDPPRCSAHGGGRTPTATPQESESAVRRGFGRKPRNAIETIDDALGHLAESLAQLADYIREHQDDLDVDEMARLCSVRGQNLNRFVRMLRDKAALQGESHTQLSAEIQEALKLASEILGVEL